MSEVAKFSSPGGKLATFGTLLAAHGAPPPTSWSLSVPTSRATPDRKRSVTGLRTSASGTTKTAWEWPADMPSAARSESERSRRPKKVT